MKESSELFQKMSEDEAESIVDGANQIADKLQFYISKFKAYLE